MVSSYLICDVCGGFGPPASFLSENGLRLCYQCWYQERSGDHSPLVDQAPDAAESGEPISNHLMHPVQSRSNS